jgi:protein associated with RNAse G/E
MTQQQLKQWISEDMQSLGYKLIPPMEFEVLDCREYDEEKRKAYYQTLTKKALELEFDKMFLSTAGFQNILKNDKTIN